ncbi:hypothetical protein V6N13_037511 [Hibiscus sabdariffa]|uniref:Uncharacterized protein n=1 Tax=Hibiscus sabdariffa TaxID=183260 RepID=A0ABR2S522_9ROSI
MLHAPNSRGTRDDDGSTATRAAGGTVAFARISPYSGFGYGKMTGFFLLFHFHLLPEVYMLSGGGAFPTTIGRFEYGTRFIVRTTAIMSRSNIQERLLWGIKESIVDFIDRWRNLASRATFAIPEASKKDKTDLTLYWT